MYEVQSTEQPDLTDRRLAVLAHVGGVPLTFVVPLAVFLICRHRSPFVRRHSTEAVNLQGTLAIGYAAIVFVGALSVTVAVVLAIALFLVDLFFVRLGVRNAHQGRSAEYLWPITFIKK